MDDHQRHIQLTHSGFSPANTVTSSRRLKGDAGLVEMCPPLYRAVHGGRVEEVMALLLQQHGAPSDHQAIASSQFIIQHGQCDIQEVCAERNTVLHVAAEQGHGELIRELYLRFRETKRLFSFQNSALDTPLHCAARGGHDKAVAVLVQLAQDCGEGESILGCKNEAGDTALHLAARRGNGAAVETLVSAAPAAAAELNNAGVSPLYLAVASRSVPCLRAIITCKDASAAGPDSQNALHAAVFQSSEMVKLLLEWRPALADQVDRDGSTPLHFASSDGHHSVVRAILRAAPPRTVYRKDHSGGLTALHVAARMGHDLIVRDVTRCCPDAAVLRDDGGGTFLHAAAREKRASVVSLAVKDPMLRGLVDARDRDGNTPLHAAVAAGAPGVVEMLLRKGKVQSDALNNDGHTPFDLAEKSAGFFIMIRLVSVLVAFGAQPRAQRQDHLKPWSRIDVPKGVEMMSDSLSVVAVLIATAGFAAGFNLPGGYGGDGKANLDRNTAFKVFLFFNTVAVASSVITVILLVYGKASRSAGAWRSFVAALSWMWVSLNSLMVAFYAALTAISSRNHRWLMVINICMQVLVFLISTWIAPANSLSTIWRSLWRGWFQARQHAIIKRQYPFASASGPTFFLVIVLNFIVSLTLGLVPNLSFRN
ncbi:hypothetical protein ACP70R_004063 [Stipagrostis hirtigluma subsp. patula]